MSRFRNYVVTESFDLLEKQLSKLTNGELVDLLRISIIENKYDIFLLLLNNNVDTNVEGQVAIVTAVNYNRPQMVKKLLMYPGVANHSDLLIIAARKGFVEVIFELLQIYYPNNVDSDGYTALMSTSSFEIVKLLAPVTDCNIQSSHHCDTALVSFIKNGLLDCATYLIPFTNCNLQNRFRQTPLMLAIIHKYENLVEQLLPDSDITLVDEFGYNALMYCVKFHSKHTKTLLQSFSSKVCVINAKDILKKKERRIMEQKDCNDMDVIALAITTKNLDFLSLLNLEFTDCYKLESLKVCNITPLMVNCIFRLGDKVQEFIDYDFDNTEMDEETTSGKTALIYAVQYDYLDIVKILLRGGADKYFRNVDGYTCIDYANSPQMRQLLFSYVID